jgi:hypothetical protein
MDIFTFKEQGFLGQCRDRLRAGTDGFRFPTGATDYYFLLSVTPAMGLDQPAVQ